MKNLERGRKIDRQIDRQRKKERKKGDIMVVREVRMTEKENWTELCSVKEKGIN